MTPLVYEWAGDPELFTLGSVTLRWYSLLFASGFVLSHHFLQRIWRSEGRDPRMVDTGIVLVIVLSLIGARLAHCLFYEPELYLKEPLKMLDFWRGGLASHGGFAGCVLAIWITLRIYRGTPLLPILDRAAPFAIFSGALIRLGNVFNAEIVGKPTDGTWGIVFSEIDDIVRHPVQVYEATGYLLVFGVALLVFHHTRLKKRAGALFGLTCILAGCVRVSCEMFKVDPFLGQALTVPYLVIGLAALAYAAARRDVSSLAPGLPALPWDQPRPRH